MSQPIAVDLPERLTIAQVESLHEKLEQVSNESQEVSLNGGAVVKADTAGLQVLYAFIQEIKKQGADITWSSSSDELKEAADLLGLRESLVL